MAHHAPRSADEGGDGLSHLDRLFDAPGPKRLLAIDGGGIRGLIAIEFLVRIEALLRERYGNRELVLADYFEYVAGTSTGAIVATLISMGRSMEEIRSFYVAGANMMFEPANLFARWARKSRGPLAMLFGAIGVFLSPAIFTPRNLTEAIMGVCGPETTLGSERIRTLLMIVMRNAFTDSPWWISNNPRATFNLPAPGGDGERYTNLDIPVWKLVRASTAAPIFFPPEEIAVPGSDRRFIFQDGGVTVYNNPAFHLFLMATLPEYRLAWPAGEDALLLVSVGTGLCESEDPDLKLRQMKLLYNVQGLPAALMRSATNEQDLLCRVFGRQPRRGGTAIWDSELGDLVSNDAPIKEKLFTYLRYNVELSERGLAQLGVAGIDPKALQPLDCSEHVAELQSVGKAAAAAITLSDFEAFL